MRFVVAAFVAVTVLPAAGTFGQVPLGDSVTGSISTGFGRDSTDLTFNDVHSGPAGENPMGTVTVGVEGGGGSLGTFAVSCMGVLGNRATVVAPMNVPPPGPAGIVIHLEDNGGSGDKADSSFVSSVPTSCPPPTTVLQAESGDVTVVDAEPPTTYAQCRQAGWVRYGYASHAQCIDAVHEYARQKVHL